MFLNNTITKDRSNRTIKIGYQRMVLDLLNEYGLSEAKPRSVPLSTGIHPSKLEGEEIDTYQFPCRTLVGSLLYLAYTSRPDIAFATSALSRFQLTPTTQHWQAAKEVMRYLAGTADYGITYGGGDLQLERYVDSDYAGGIDTRHSTMGHVFLLNGGAIS